VIALISPGAKKPDGNKNRECMGRKKDEPQCQYNGLCQATDAPPGRVAEEGTGADREGERVIIKAITVRQPHASLIALGKKRNETRGWATKHRGLLAIHAGKAYPKKLQEMTWTEPFRQVGLKNNVFFPLDFPLGAVIAVCNLTTIYKINGYPGSLYLINIDPPAKYIPDSMNWPIEPELSFGDYSVGRYAWMLEDVKMLPEPIPCRGHQKMWNWEVPGGVGIDD
jgi:hypothetical protein